jgi:hypothetical protein
MLARPKGVRPMSIQPVGAWRQVQNWFNFQGAIIRQDAALHDAVNAAFATAQSNYYQTLAGLATKAALTRLQNEAKAKAAGLTTLINSIGGTVNKVA